MWRIAALHARDAAGMLIGAAFWDANPLLLALIGSVASRP